MFMCAVFLERIISRKSRSDRGLIRLRRLYMCVMQVSYVCIQVSQELPAFVFIGSNDCAIYIARY